MWHYSDHTMAIMRFDSDHVTAIMRYDSDHATALCDTTVIMLQQLCDMTVILLWQLCDVTVIMADILQASVIDVCKVVKVVQGNQSVQIHAHPYLFLLLELYY